MLPNCKGLNFLTAHSLSIPVWGFTFPELCCSTPLKSLLSYLLSGEKRNKRKPEIGFGSQEDPQVTKRTRNWNGFLGRKGITKKEGKLSTPIQGNWQWAGVGYRAKIWKSQAHAAEHVGLSVEGGAWKELPVWTSTADPLVGGSYQGPPELLHYWHIIQFLPVPFSFLFTLHQSLRTSISFPRLSPPSAPLTAHQPAHQCASQCFLLFIFYGLS